MFLWKLIKSNYHTYINIRNNTYERHWGRLLFSIFLSFLISTFSDNMSIVYPIMITVITILTGFTFSALFSSHIITNSNLPQPSSEDDRIDLQRIDQLANSFKSRSSYFILISIINSVLLIAASLKFTTPSVIIIVYDFVADYFLNLLNITAITLPTGTGYYLGIIFSTGVLALFLECLYTFYRLSETVMAIVDTRNEYLSQAGRRD